MIVKVFALIFKIILFYSMNLAMICACRDLNEYQANTKLDRIMLIGIAICAFIAQCAMLAM